VLTVGKHYVQQALLRHFQDPNKPGFIWTYIRDEEEPRLLPIDKVAQSPDFYDDDVERDLNVLVERPTTPILDALRRGETPDAAGRTAIALYAATCIKRVPRAREQGKGLIPHALNVVVEGLRAELPELSGGDPIRLEKLRTDLEAAYEKYRIAPPPEVLDQLRDPRPTQKMVNALLGMSWRLVMTEPPELFLTSDNPLFYFEGLGVGNTTSEFAFPLSPTRCLHGCFQPLRLGGSLELRQAERPFVHEVNRRMANNATKLLFANVKAEFPITLLRKGRDHYLSRINWTY